MALPAAVLLAVFFGVALLPGRIEGIYHPPGFVSTFGCDAPQYCEFIGGRWNYHIRCGDPHDASFYYGDYTRSADGSCIELRSRPGREEARPLLAKAYSHLFFTRFVMPATGESFWSWKLPVTPPLRDWLAKTRMFDIYRDATGVRKMIYDHEGHLVEEAFTPCKPKP